MVLFFCLIFDKLIAVFLQGVNCFLERFFIFMFMSIRWRVAAAISINQQVIAVSEKPKFFLHGNKVAEKERSARNFSQLDYNSRGSFIIKAHDSLHFFAGE